MKTMRSLWRIFNYTKDCRAAWLFSKLAPIFADFISTLLSALAVRYLFICFQSRNIKDLYLTIIFSVLGFTVDTLFSGLLNYFRARSSAILKKSLQCGLLDKALKIPIRTEEQEHSGQMLSRHNQDVDTACEALDNTMDKIVLPIFLGLGFLLIVFFTAWEIALFYCVMLFPIAVIGKCYAGKFRSMGVMVQKSLAKFNERFSDLLAGAVTIKNFILEGHMKERVADAADDLLNIKMKDAKLTAKYLFSINIFSYSFVTFPIIIGCFLVSIGRMFLPDVMFVSRYTRQIRELAKSLISASSEMQRQMAAVDRLFEVLDAKEESAFYGNQSPDGDADPVLELQNVSVRYRDSSVVSSLNMTAKKNQTIALVGPSGSGKSTILKAILQFVRYSGEIRLFGKLAEEYDINALRSKIAYVSQDNILFEGTVYENILFGDPAASAEDIHECAKKAFAHDFILGLPNGYDTPIGENGFKLSGGQRQRIAIARALLKNAPLLLLDEATSSLDSQSENEVQKEIRALEQGRTIVVVAHRLSTIVNADRIYVIDHGTVVQVGKHPLLIHEDGMYKTLYDLQYPSLF